MATSVPKSYQALSKHPAQPKGPASPADPNGPASPAPLTFPHTFTEKLFQVPAGKTWQVLRLIMRKQPPSDPVEFFRVEKASSGGAIQIALLSDGQGDVYVPPIYELDSYFRDLVLEDQEILRQVVRIPTQQTKLTIEYELSVLEFTP